LRSGGAGGALARGFFAAVSSVSLLRRCGIGFGSGFSGAEAGVWLAFVADGAVLGFVIFHGDFEHVVAANADAVDFGWGLGARFGFGGVGRMFGVLRFGHGRILA
jgi:hypothetical protein